MDDSRHIEQIDDIELERFDNLFSIPMILFNESRLFYMNKSCKQLLGYEADELPQMDFMNVAKLFEIDFLPESLHSILHKGTDPFKHEISILDNNQNRIWVEYTGRVVLYHSERCILATLIDITDKKQIQLDLMRVSKIRSLMLEVTQSILKTEDIFEMFQLILTNALKALEKGSLGTILIRETDFFTVASSVGYNETVKNFVLPYEDAFLYKATNGKMDQIANIPDLLAYDKYHRIETNFGAQIFIKSTISAPIYIKGSLFGMINIDSVEINSFDDDDVKAMEFMRNHIEIALSNHLKYKEKAFMARYDRLTRLYNRFYFEEQFEIVKERALRYKEEFNIVMFDINSLKITNDTYGHLIGDMVIQKIASVMARDTRKSDIIARLGGDEFIGIFFNTDVKTLREKCRMLLANLEKEPLYVDNNKIICSFSFGISSFPEEGRELEDLIRIADERMYAFKKSLLGHQP